MKKSQIALALLASVFTLPMAAQSASANSTTARPLFVTLPPSGDLHPGVHHPSSLQTWNGTITYSGHTYNFTMVGTDPSTTNTTTTITAYLIPVKMVYSKKVYGKSHHTFDPNVDTQNGVSITQNMLNSPLFNNLDWKWGATDVGTTQYEDGWQRGSFWGNVSTNTNYHVVLTPSVLTEKTITVSKAEGGNVTGNPFGGTGKVGEMNINNFDSKIQGFMRGFSQINPTNVAIFVTDNIYLTSGGCCIGGYHSAAGAQTYMTATYAYSSVFVFSNDISAFSHEIGEWYADPLITSNSPCGLLEVGDPLEGKANYGDFDVTFGGVTWHPQNLVWMEYFGDPANFSANNWLDNGHIETSVCENGH